MRVGFRAALVGLGLLILGAGHAAAQLVATEWDLSTTNATEWMVSGAADSYLIATSVSLAHSGLAGTWRIEGGFPSVGFRVATTTGQPEVVGVTTLLSVPATTGGYFRLALTTGIVDPLWRVRWTKEGLGLASSGRGAVAVHRTARVR